MSWTDERVETLKRMWTEGQSASQIAKELGGVTRNAVIGKVHRLGLSNRVGGVPGPATTPSVAGGGVAAAAMGLAGAGRTAPLRDRVDVADDMDDDTEEEVATPVAADPDLMARGS